MDDRELRTLPGWKQRDMVVGKKISSRELVEASLRRIDAVDGQLHAFLTVDREGALKAADEADRAVSGAADPSAELGAFHGVPISIKDLELTRGLRTTLGCKVFEDWVPDYDSIVVERVRKSGAVIVGKTQTPEFGNAAESYNKVGPATNNPRNIERTPGGSSGGSGPTVAAGPGADPPRPGGGGLVAGANCQASNPSACRWPTAERNAATVRSTSSLACALDSIPPMPIRSTPWL